MEGVGGQDSVFHRSLSEKWRQITHGEGVYLFDSEGRRYLDACAGVHVVSIGHGVPEIAEAMREQARKVSFTYSRFLTQPQLDLAEKIAEMASEVRIPVKPATESGANRPGRSEATPEVDNHLRSGRFESIHRSLLG